MKRRAAEARTPAIRSFGVAVAISGSVLIAHAFDLFAHEYAHSLAAWLLGWKHAPFAIHLGTGTLDNVLIQQQVNEDVDYDPIFRGGHGWQAALIAAAGPFGANGGVALACHAAIRRMGAAPRPALWALVWIDAFATFNVWSYAPIRTLANHGDMAFVARGLAISPWLVFPAATAIAGWLVWRFVRIALPIVQARLDPTDPARTLSAVVLGTAIGFFSIAGLGGGYGVPASVMGVLSLFLLLPWALVASRGREADDQSDERHGSAPAGTPPVIP